jgi:hypothetical protein
MHNIIFGAGSWLWELTKTEDTRRARRTPRYRRLSTGFRIAR